MSSLSKLKFVTGKRTVVNSPIVMRRQKLASKLQEQADLVAAKKVGQSYVATRPKWLIDSESGEKKLVNVPKRVKEWFWIAENGKINLAVKYGARVIEVSKGKNAIEVGSADELHSALQLLKEATLGGELDDQIDSAAKSLKNGFKQV